MSAVLELMRACKKSGVKISVNGQKLKIDAPTGLPNSIKEDLRRHKTDIIEILTRKVSPETLESETLTQTLNRMIAAGASFETSIDDFQISGADKLSESDKQFLTVNRLPILCTLQQGALVKYLFSQKPDTRQKFVSEVNRQGASFEAVCEITAEWFGRLLDTIQ